MTTNNIYTNKNNSHTITITIRPLFLICPSIVSLSYAPSYGPFVYPIIFVWILIALEDWGFVPMSAGCSTPGSNLSWTIFLLTFCITKLIFAKISFVLVNWPPLVDIHTAAALSWYKIMGCLGGWSIWVKKSVTHTA